MKNFFPAFDDKMKKIITTTNGILKLISFYLTGHYAHELLYIITDLVNEKKGRKIKRHNLRIPIWLTFARHSIIVMDKETYLGFPYQVAIFTRGNFSLLSHSRVVGHHLLSDCTTIVFSCRRRLIEIYKRRGNKYV